LNSIPVFQINHVKQILKLDHIKNWITIVCKYASSMCIRLSITITGYVPKLIMDNRSNPIRLSSRILNVATRFGAPPL